MAPTTNDRITEGPAASPDAAAVRTNKPAPMIAPMPRAIKLLAGQVFEIAAAGLFEQRIQRFFASKAHGVFNQACDYRQNITKVLVL